LLFNDGQIISQRLGFTSMNDKSAIFRESIFAMEGRIETFTSVEAV
jgi:hypothetical protein